MADTRVIWTMTERKRIEEILTEWIEDHIVTKPSGKLIRIIPFEWDDFKKELFGEIADKIDSGGKGK